MGTGKRWTMQEIKERVEKMEEGGMRDTSGEVDHEEEKNVIFFCCGMKK